MSSDVGVSPSSAARTVVSTQVAPERPALRVGTYSSDTWRRLRRNRTAMFGGVILLLLIVGSVGAPLISPYDPIIVDGSSLYEPPNWQHLFGTDELGRDIFTRVLYGGQISLWVGIVSVGISVVFGLILGLTAGYFTGMTDDVISRVIDVMLAFPGIMLAIAVVATLGISMTNLMIAVGISFIPHYTRVVRASVMAAKVNLYVDAARVVGCRDLQIMIRHILPNALTSLMVVATLGLGSAILIAAGLSFLGLGAQPPTPEWGSMVARGRSFLRLYWWICTFPGAVVMLTVLSINLVGDGLRDALDPRWRQRI
jgi:peptide/nickel transport system permease protein